MRHETFTDRSSRLYAAESRLRGAAWRPAILVVDDDRDIEKQVRHILKGCLPQADCFWVKSGSEAYHMLKSGLLIPDLVLIDIFMPGQLDGFSLLQKLPSLKVEAPVVMISNLSQLGYHKLTRTLPFAPPFLEKPFDELDVQATLAGLLNRSGK